METKYKRLVELPLYKLIEESNLERLKSPKLEADICTIISAKSGACSEDCRFCAQSSHYKTDSPLYELKSVEEIVEAAKTAKENGAKRFAIVTSGNSLSAKEFASIMTSIREINSNANIIACASLGKLTVEQLLELKSAGLKRYHHNIETSREYYCKIVSTHEFDERVQTVLNTKAAGLEICCGGILGLGESWEDRISMALTLKELDVDAVPLNLLVPIKGTPLENSNSISPVDAVRTIAIFRIILGDKSIKVAAGRETILKDHQSMAFLAGANGMLIGGYLTTRGRSVEEDKKFIKEIEEILAK